MGTEEDMVRNLRTNYLVRTSQDTYLICQRLDRIIALLERQSPPRDPAALPGYFNPPHPVCPNCGYAGPKDAAVGLFPKELGCPKCHHVWPYTKDIPL